MGQWTICCLLVLIAALYGAQAASECPEKSNVHLCTPKCIGTTDCSLGRICCPNQCGTKSCSEPAKYTGGGSKYSSSGGTGVYCNNVKCNSYEKCVQDKATGRLACKRA